MVVKHNQSISELSWISRGGLAKTYYIPETIEELVELIKGFCINKQRWELIGLTSNIYFKNSFNVDNLISTKELRKWKEYPDTVWCECGVNVHLLSQQMVKEGIKGFEGLIDLPGTIGGALYGNAGCFDCSISSLLVQADLLMSDGTIKTLTKADFHFSNRLSDLKRGVLNGVILSVTLKKEPGNLDQIQNQAALNHQIRLETQPGPKNNLGSTYCDLGRRTLFGKAVAILSSVYSKSLQVIGLDIKTRTHKKSSLEFVLAGGRKVLPYLFSPGRFIWKDEYADDVFLLYQKVLSRLYINPRLEIEIKE